MIAFNLLSAYPLLILKKRLEEVCDAFVDMQQTLAAAGLIIAPEKIQAKPPYFNLGHILQKGRIKPQKLQFDSAHLKTLHDWQ